MSAVLFREGEDLDQLLAELDAEHPDGVRVVDVRYDREGGVLGFFARRRVAVSYTPAEPGHVTPAQVEPTVIAEEPGDCEPEPVDDRAEFARMLLEMAAEKAAQRSREDEPVIDPYDVFTPRGRHAAPEPDAGIVVPPPATAVSPSVFAQPVAPQPVAPEPVAAQPVAPSPVAAPPVEPEPVAAQPVAPEPVAPLSAPATGHALPGRRRLLDLGIPGEWLPIDTADPVAGIRAGVGRVRPARPPQGSSFVLVVAGPAALALETARQVQQRLGLRRPVLTVGIDAETQLCDERQAAWLAGDVRLGDAGPAVVAVSLDQQADAGWGDDNTRRIVDRLQPDAVWGVADARWRSSDVRASFAQLPRTDALAIVHADRTASPAGLWDLDLPVALIDGRPATPAAWTALLLDRLDALG